MASIFNAVFAIACLLGLISAGVAGYFQVLTGIHRKPEYSYSKAASIFTMIYRDEVYTAKGLKCRRSFWQFTGLFFLCIIMAFAVSRFSSDIHRFDQAASENSRR
jgi:hypothetical protein